MKTDIGRPHVDVGLGGHNNLVFGGQVVVAFIEFIEQASRIQAHVNKVFCDRRRRAHRDHLAGGFFFARCHRRDVEVGLVAHANGVRKRVIWAKIHAYGEYRRGIAAQTFDRVIDADGAGQKCALGLDSHRRDAEIKSGFDRFFHRQQADADCDIVGLVGFVHAVKQIDLGDQVVNAIRHVGQVDRVSQRQHRARSDRSQQRIVDICQHLIDLLGVCRIEFVIEIEFAVQRQKHPKAQFLTLPSAPLLVALAWPVPILLN